MVVILGEDVAKCASGTDALLLPLKALDLRPGDEVIRRGLRQAAAAGGGDGLHTVFDVRNGFSQIRATFVVEGDADDDTLDALGSPRICRAP